LNRPLGTVKTQIRSAMKKLSEVLADAAPLHQSMSDVVVDSSTEHPPSHVSHSRGMHAFDATANQTYGDFSGDSPRK
jgi:hypothetical protein